MYKVPDNELRVDLLASAGVNPWAQHDSSSRVQMLGGHLGQALVIDGASPRRCFTGMERELGRFTFNVKMPANAEIIRVIDKYPRTIGPSSVKENPLSVIVYEDVESKMVGIVTLPRWHCRHQHFGFRYKMKSNALNRLVPGATIGKGTILADSPAVDDMGNYMIGTETEVAFMSVPGIIEDGVIVSKDYLKKLTTHGFESRVAVWGTRYYPLNLYGTDTEYKPFPDIGDRIREDGLLFALRQYDPLLGPVEMTPKALREPDFTFDRLTYAEPGAKVIDVNIRRQIMNGPPPTPVGMEVQTNKYYTAQLQFYRNLLDTYNELKRRRKETLKITEEFHRLLVEALIYTSEPGKIKAKLIHQRMPLDDWRVEVTFDYEIVPTVPFKVTDFHGGKGVICAVWDTEDMPVDEHGNRAECIMDGDSTIKRMNIGRLYEQYINATSRHVTDKIKEWMANPTPENVDKAWQYVLGYYKILSPRMYDLITGPSYGETPRGHLDAIVRPGSQGVRVWMPTDNPAYSPDIIEQLVKHYPIKITPVTYKGRSGNVVRTVSPILIGSVYMMLLEKTGGDWSAVSSSKLQHFGIPARQTKFDKHSLPGRANPVRIAGESEVRLFAATIGGEATAELLEMSNSPQTHKHIYANILRAEKPTAIKNVVDRTQVPMGTSRALLFVHHALQCNGIEFYYEPENDNPPKIYYPNPDEIMGDAYKAKARKEKAVDEEEATVDEEVEESDDNESGEE